LVEKWSEILLQSQRRVVVVVVVVVVGEIIRAGNKAFMHS
jgi:hypothetical protein